MSTMKKTLSILLALVLIVSCIPATALSVFATEEEASVTNVMNLSTATLGSIESAAFFSTSASGSVTIDQYAVDVVEGKGYNGTNALAFSDFANLNYSMWNNLDLTHADAKAGLGVGTLNGYSYQDILWFYADGTGLSTQNIRLNLKVNGVTNNKGMYYYTLTQSEGLWVETKETMVKASTNDGAVLTAIAEGTVKINKGFTGWIGIPLSNYYTSGTVDITKLVFHVRNEGTRVVLTTADSFTVGNFCIGSKTNAGWVWPVSNPKPEGTFYDVIVNGTGVESDGEATVEEGKTYSATLTALAGYTLPESVTVTVGGEAAAHTYNAATGALAIANVTGEVVITAVATRIPQIPLVNFNSMSVGATAGVEDTNGGDITNTVAAGVGIGGSNALNYVIVETGSNNSNNVKLESILASHTVGADTDILWMWVDSDLTAERLLHIQGPTNLFNGNLDNAVLYTIVNDNGTAKIQEKTDDVVNNTTLEGMGLVHSAWNADTGSYARIKIPAGWYGWLGVPVSALGYTAGSAISNLKVRLYATASEAPIGANECFYIDELWLTSADLMPNLTNDELLYNGDQAYLSLNSRYADGMIFQQNKPFMIHGKANSGAEVKVELLDSTNTAVQTKTVTVGEDENWSVLFEGVAGSYDIYSVKVTAANLTKTVSNVVFGEVWVAGGQSNMDYTINQTAGNVSNDSYAAGIAQAFGSDVDVAELLTRLAAEGSNAQFIRIYLQDSVAANQAAESINAAGRWTNGSVESDVKASSAIAFYYAEMLQSKLDMPVGIIETPKGGTSMITWVDKDVLTEAKYPEAYKVATDLGYFTSTGAATQVAAYFNTRINPFQGYEVKGVLWYQGENDRFNPEAQRVLPPVLLESWSKVFTTDPANVSNTALDFVVFQIAPFIGYVSGGVYPDANLMTNTDLNAAMREGFAEVAKTGNVVIIPIYDLSAVVDNHHPLNKLDVANRLMAALNETYYAPTFHDTYTGPAVTGVTFADGTVTVTFDKNVRYIQLTETGNQRINPRGGFAMPAATELWGDKANGFSLYTGKAYVSVETVAIDGNKVTLTVPEGVTSIAGVAYAYGLEVLSANIYSATGLPALPFYAENPDYVPEPEEPADPVQVQLWDADDNTTGQTIGTVDQTTTHNHMSSTIKENVGVLGSKAWAYVIEESKSNNNYQKVTVNLADIGFDTTTTVSSTEQILWFWVDGDMENVVRMHVEVNGSRMSVDPNVGGTFYTIGEDENGKPVIVEVAYQYGQIPDNDGIDGLSFTHYNSAEGNTNKFARPVFTGDWSGWVGLPIKYLAENASDMVAEGEAFAQLIIQGYRNNGFKAEDGTTLLEGYMKTGDAIYFDEFWLTDAGLMPKLSDEALLYKGDVVTPEPEEPTVYNVTFNGTNVTSNGAATVTEGETYTATLTAAEGYVLPESVTVTVGGEAVTATYDAATGALSIANVTGDVVITAVAEEEPESEPTVYNVTFNGTNVTSNGAATVTEGETYTATLTAAEGYVLPESVTVTVGGEAVTATYDAATGALSIANVTGDVVITAVAEEEPEPEPEEPVQVQLWDLESVAAGTTIGTVANGSNNTISSTAVTDYGVLGSKAIAFTFTGGKVNTTNSGTATISDLNTLGFDTDAQIGSYDQIVWFWVDSDLSSDQRLAILFNNLRTKAQGDVYTIQADSNGKPQIVKVAYQYSDADGDADGITGISYLDYVSNNANNQNSIGRVKISAGWSGWVGIAVNTIRKSNSTGNYLKPTDTFTSITLQLYKGSTLDAGTIVAGDTIYFDEFWLTDAGQMPKLSDEALLYKGDVVTPEPEPLAFSGASLTLEEGISVNFKVDGDVIKQGYENPYAVLKIRDLEYTVEGVYDETKDEYVFKLYNIRPDWMGETITAEIYATMDGEQVAGEAITYSVAQYCYNILQKNYATATEADKLATLLVNILSYGAAAQTYAGETANGLVTDDLTETWAGWITTDYTAAAADTSISTDLAEPGVTFQSASLFLRESVRIRLKLAGTVSGPVTVKVTDAAGNAITESVMAGCNGYVFLDGLNAQQMRTVLKITVYSGEEAVSNTLTYSIRSYADSFILADSTTALAKLMKAMMIYGDSAAAYIQ